jgi:hypothetical protein
MPVIPALGRFRKEDLKFEASLSYIVRPCLKKNNNKKKKKKKQKPKTSTSDVICYIEIFLFGIFYFFNGTGV